MPSIIMSFLIYSSQINKDLLVRFSFTSCRRALVKVLQHYSLRGWGGDLLRLFKTQSFEEALEEALSNVVWLWSFEQEVGLHDLQRPLPTSGILWLSGDLIIGNILPAKCSPFSLWTYLSYKLKLACGLVPFKNGKNKRYILQGKWLPGTTTNWKVSFWYLINRKKNF